MASIIKVDNVQNTPGTNVVSKCGTDITLGASGDTVALACGASQTGFGRTGTVDWVTTVQTGTITAATGKGYFVNTTSGEITANLPAGAAGSIVAFKDYANTWDTNKLIVTPNGSEKIGGNVGSLFLTTESQSITLVYIDATKGWMDIHDSTSNAAASSYIVATGGTPCAGATCGDYKIHTFTGPGTLCVSAGSGALAVAEYIVVAGGGGGGCGGCRAGGGGAGGFRFASPSLAPATYPAKPIAAPAALPLPINPYPITVGGAGAIATQGDNSVFSTITSTGGGKGGGPGGAPSPVAGGPGGSGGGGGGNTGGTATGGTGNTPVVSPAQGFDGGPGGTNPSFGGGGGGALAVGVTGTNAPPQPTGASGGVGGGFPSAFGTSGHSTGGFYYFSGGAGGAYYGDAVPGGVGGLGGGGNGQGYNGAAATAGSAGTTNTGGGGGGAGLGGPTATAYAGGSGIVIIRYKFQ
mgnify:CR=1 FL=1